MISVDYLIHCDFCDHSELVEDGPFQPGEKPRACPMPTGWRVESTGKLRCRSCIAKKATTP